jgi:dTDP-glucose pyrophosphorylase
MNYLILAAGHSTRYGCDKLREPVRGKTLPVRAAEFALRNGADTIFLTLNRRTILTDGKEVYHPILKDLTEAHPDANFRVRFQDEEKYGPGEAICCWRGAFDGNFVVLFGDNYYSGTLPTLNANTTYFSVQHKTAHPRNRQLAAVVDTEQGSMIIEKPHAMVEGNFFCGFVHFPAEFWDTLPYLMKSDRNEYEIADLINFQRNRQTVDLGAAGLVWGDLTYKQDLEYLESLVS